MVPRIKATGRRTAAATEIKGFLYWRTLSAQRSQLSASACQGEGSEVRVASPDLFSSDFIIGSADAKANFSDFSG